MRERTPFGTEQPTKVSAERPTAEGSPADPLPGADADVTPTPVDGSATLPEGARIWENRSGEEGSGYVDFVGPDIAYADGTWFAQSPDGTWQAFHEGPTLDFTEVDSATVEALRMEATAGTALFGAPVDHLGLSLDGATGGWVTQDGTHIDPTQLELVRAADGSVVWFDGATGSWWAYDEPGTPIEVPPGPYSTVIGGPGAAPPLDALDPGQALGFDPATQAYLHPDHGAVVGFHQGVADDLRRWDNRSGEPDSPYQDFAGDDIVYLDGVWYQVQPTGEDPPLHERLQAFHEGPVLDLAQVDSSTVEYLHQELLAGTPLAGQGHLSDLGLRLDGESGALIDEAGNPVDLATYDPWAQETNESTETLTGSGSETDDGLPDDPELTVDADAEPAPSIFGDPADGVDTPTLTVADPAEAPPKPAVVEPDPLDDPRLLNFGSGARPTADLADRSAETATIEAAATVTTPGEPLQAVVGRLPTDLEPELLHQEPDRSPFLDDEADGPEPDRPDPSHLDEPDLFS